MAETKKITITEFADAICISTRTFYYWKKELRTEDLIVKDKSSKEKKDPPVNKLTVQERKKVVSVLLKPEWVDLSPREIYYKLLDEENLVIASISTFYRIAKEKDILVNRVKTQSEKKLNREKPVLLTLNSNEVWSWDVTQISSTRRSERYYLYVIIDIWSRYVVGWSLEYCEKSDLAIQVWKRALEDQVISGTGLINHKDNGSIMTSKEMIKFVNDVKMVDSYSRAGVSDDNPFSESLFRTIKYFRDFPECFETLEDGRKYFENYFHEYNFIFRHSGIQFLTPASRHYGEEVKILNFRNQVIQDFYKKNSHRYSHYPKVFQPIKEVRIN